MAVALRGGRRKLHPSHFIIGSDKVGHDNFLSVLPKKAAVLDIAAK